jgi:hypothetical protein
MVKQFRLGVLGLVALSAVAFAAVDGFSVKRTPKEGQTIKYAMEGSVDMQGQTITIKGVVQEKVVKVSAEGFGVEQNQIESKVILPDGNEMDMPQGGATITNYKPNGELVDIKGSSEDATSYRMATLGLLIEPGKMVNIGDKWTHEIKSDTKTGVAAATAEYTLVAEEKVGNYDTLKVKAVVKETEGSEPASSEGFVWLDKKDGSTVKAETKWNKAPFPGPAGPMILDATIKLNRID